MYPSENFTRRIVRFLVPLYGKIFKWDTYTVDQFDHVSRLEANQKERGEYFNYASTTLKGTGVSLGVITVIGAVLSLAINFVAIGVFLSFFLSFSFVCMGQSYDYVIRRNEKTKQSYTKNILYKAISWAIFIGIFASFLLTAGTSTLIRA